LVGENACRGQTPPLRREGHRHPRVTMLRPSLLRTATRVSCRRGMAEMPVVPQSMTAKPSFVNKNEGWETTMLWWYSTSAVLLTVILATRPDTEITSWASKEAEARLKLKEAGVVTEFEFGKHYQALATDADAEGWEKFAAKSLRFLEDDDDEDDDEEDDE